MRDEELDRLLEQILKLRRRGRLDEALRLVAETEKVADPFQELALRTVRGLAEMDGGSYASARDTFGELVLILEGGAVGNKLMLASALDNLGYVEREIGDYAAAQRHHERAVELLRIFDAPEELARALVNLAIVQKDTGQMQRALISIKEAAEWAPADNEQLIGYIHSVRGLIHETLSEWDDARREFVRALVAFRRTGDRENAAAMLHDLAVVEGERDRMAVAMRFLRHSIRMNDELGNIGGAVNDRRRLALYAADAGERAEARRMLLRARRGAKRIGDRDLEILCELDLARVAILTRNPRETLKRTSRALRLGRGFAVPVVMYEILVTRGIGWQESGRWTRAVKTYAAALGSLELVRHGMATEELTLRYFSQPSDVHRALVEMSIRRGDRRGAWSWAEKTRGRELNRRIRRSPSLRSHTVSADLLAHEAALLRSLETALQSLEQSATSEAGEAVDAVTEELNAVWDQIRPVDPEYVALRTGEPVTFTDVRRDLERWSADLRKSARR